MQDYAKRNFVASLLADFLEVDIAKKSSQGIKMVSLNYMDQPSLLTWLELRKLTFDMGKQFKIRLEYNMGCFVILCVAQILLLSLKAFNYLDLSPFISTQQWILILVHLSVHVIFAIPALVSAARTNE